MLKMLINLRLTVRLSLVTDVFSSPQGRVTLPAAEVLLVVLVFIRRDELLAEYELVARVASRS